MRVLGIETSCDETSLAVLEVARAGLKLASFLVSSQVTLHARWGGVVPELAARRHAETIIPLAHETLRRAKINPRQLDGIAVTLGPGLITALQVGVETAKALSYAWGKPLVGVNHIASHLVSPFLTTPYWLLAHKKTIWPAVALVVSGGHTELYVMPSISRWQLLGKTLDDAAGEAFDKVAKMLRLPYPGGPQVAKLAQHGDPNAYNFPRPLVNRASYDFSYAGLKTAVLYALQKEKHVSPCVKANLCASFQQAAVEVLVAKTLHAAQASRARSVLVVGGVSANAHLRSVLTNKLRGTGTRLLLPELRFTGDNAAMVALAGAVPLPGTKKLAQNSWRKLQANANWELW